MLPRLQRWHPILFTTTLPCSQVVLANIGSEPHGANLASRHGSAGVSIIGSAGHGMILVTPLSLLSYGMVGGVVEQHAIENATLAAAVRSEEGDQTRRLVPKIVRS